MKNNLRLVLVVSLLSAVAPAYGMVPLLRAGASRVLGVSRFSTTTSVYFNAERRRACENLAKRREERASARARASLQRKHEDACLWCLHHAEEVAGECPREDYDQQMEERLCETKRDNQEEVEHERLRQMKSLLEDESTHIDDVERMLKKL